VIQIDADEEEYLGHSNITLATFEKMSDGSYIIKPIKQKQMVRQKNNEIAIYVNNEKTTSVN